MRRWVQASHSLLDCGDGRVTFLTLAVYYALRSFTNAKDTCFPSVPAVARRARVGTSTARAQIRLLEELGYVEILEHGGFGRRSAHLYRVRLDPPDYE